MAGAGGGGECEGRRKSKGTGDKDATDTAAARGAAVRGPTMADAVAGNGAVGDGAVGDDAVGAYVPIDRRESGSPPLSISLIARQRTINQGDRLTTNNTMSA